MKEYIKPTVDRYNVRVSNFFAASPGVETGDGLGNGYDPDAPDYAKGSTGEWDDDDDLDGGSNIW